MIVPDYVWHTMGGVFLGVMGVLGLGWFKSLTIRVKMLEDHVVALEGKTKEQAEVICNQKKRIKTLAQRLEKYGIAEESEAEDDGC